MQILWSEENDSRKLLNKFFVMQLPSQTMISIISSQFGFENTNFTEKIVDYGQWTLTRWPRLNLL